MENAIRNFELYLRNQQNFKDRSVKEYMRVIRYVSRHINIVEAQEYKEVESAILAVKAEEEWGPMMTAKAGSIMVRVYRWLAKEKLISHNPFTFHDFRKPRQKEPKWTDDVKHKNVCSHPLLSLQEMLILQMFYDTGMRRAELAALNIEDIDASDNMAHVRMEISKGEYGARWCPFSRKTGKLLYRHINRYKVVGIASGALFRDRKGKRIRENFLSALVAEIGQFDAPLKPRVYITPHMYRHGWAGRMLDNGADGLFIMKNLGHHSQTQLLQYTHLAKKSTRKLYDQYA